MKKIKDKKKIGKIIIVIGIILVLIGILLNALNSTDLSKYEAPNNINSEDFSNIQYSIPINTYCSCATFGENNKFYEYDCDSEPSSMPFSGELYDTYEYKNGKIKFTGKNVMPVTGKVLEWTKDKFVIKVNGLKQDKNCSINNYNIYEYYTETISLLGKEMKEYMDEINPDKNLTIEYWPEKGTQKCNKKDKERCYGAEIITNEEIYSQIRDDIYYLLSYFRDKEGNVKSVSVTDDFARNHELDMQ